MKKCKVCGEKTEVIFNINFKATPICESCATSIFLQQAQQYGKTKGKNKKKMKLKLNIGSITVIMVTILIWWFVIGLIFNA